MAVALGILLVVFLADLEISQSEMRPYITAGFRRVNQSAQLLELMERSVLDTPLLMGFLEAAGATDEKVHPLLQRLARREIERAAWFVWQLPVGNGLIYDGEDREWMLGLTEEAERSIDAISLSTVDAGLRGFDGGLWTSDLGARYLSRQRQAIGRNVSIRRIFVFENEELASDETFLKITQMQREVGVDVRMLDQQLIPERLKSMIFDFIIFDDAISYETTPAATFTAKEIRPAIFRTMLAPMPDRIRQLRHQFEELWAAADPDRSIDK